MGILMLTVFGAETAVMFLLPFILPVGTSETTGALLDATMLSLLISPAVWRSLVRPLRADAQRLSDLNEKLKTNMAARAKLEEDLKRQALYDALTGLPNRGLFMKELERRLRRLSDRAQRQFAIFFVDLDHFKSINDTLGHGAGDRLLEEAARRLELAVRPSDMVARLGGDEFIVLLDNMNGREESVRVAQRIVAQMAAPFFVGTPEGKNCVKLQRTQVSASVGIAFPAWPAQTAEQLLHEADVAMYRAKANGGNRFEISEANVYDAAVLADSEDPLPPSGPRQTANAEAGGA